MFCMPLPPPAPPPPPGWTVPLHALYPLDIAKRDAEIAALKAEIAALKAKRRLLPRNPPPEPSAAAVPISPTYKPHYFFRHGGWWRIVYRGAPKIYKTYMLPGAPWDDQIRLWPAFPLAPPVT